MDSGDATRATVSVLAVGIAGLREPNGLGRIFSFGHFGKLVSFCSANVLYRSKGDPHIVPLQWTSVRV